MALCGSRLTWLRVVTDDGGGRRPEDDRGPPGSLRLVDDVRLGDNRAKEPRLVDYVKFALAVVSLWMACEHLVQRARRLGFLK